MKYAMTEQANFVEAIVACINYDHALNSDELRSHLSYLFNQSYSTKDELMQLQTKLEQLSVGRRIALVYGGATKIKEYVFEAPKLPEIRGASALLDWINELQLPQLWGAKNTAYNPEYGIIYASGGNILAFAAEHEAQQRATAIERLYTDHSLSANSVAVYESFSLLELRYGRNPLAYWFEDFARDWADEQKQAVLKQYYYLPDGVDAAAADALQQRFFNRKCFGELVTILATSFNRRRNERSYAGDTRSIPFYQMLPLAQKCDGSGSRPVVLTTHVGNDTRAISEITARKLEVGRIVKGNKHTTTKLEKMLEWNIPDDIISWRETFSWERCWERYIEEEAGQHSFYARSKGNKKVRPAKDVHEIGAASKGYIGIIYADGNNVGRLIATLKTPDSYHKVSRILSDAARETVFQALSDYIQPIPSPVEDNNVPYLYPFEILTIGGDDLFLIVPANKAFDIATAIAARFEAQITDKLEKLHATLPAGDLRLPAKAISVASYHQRYRKAQGLTDADLHPSFPDDYTPSIGLSAGVIIAQETAPIFFLRDLVEELLKSAKAKAKDQSKQNFYGGAIDFMVMKSITMVTDKIKSFRKQALADNGVESMRRLTARPYTWYEFAGLLTTVRELKEARVPRSQLYRLRRILDQEPGTAITPSVMEYLYTRTRLSQRYNTALQSHIERAWCWEKQLPERRFGLPPWMPLGTHGWETIWPDLLEVYEMVAEKQQSYAILPEKEQQ